MDKLVISIQNSYRRKCSERTSVHNVRSKLQFSDLIWQDNALISENYFCTLKYVLMRPVLYGFMLYIKYSTYNLACFTKVAFMNTFNFLGMPIASVSVFLPLPFPSTSSTSLPLSLSSSCPLSLSSFLFSLEYGTASLWEPIIIRYGV